MSIEVSSLSIYPVKSLSGLLLDTRRVDSFGLYQDRRWMVVDKDQRFVTQREQPTMCLILVTLSSNGIRLTTPNMEDIDVTVPQASNTETIDVIVWKDSCQALDGGDAVATWLSQFLQFECRLMYFPENSVRLVDQDYAQADDKTAFSDGFPVLLTSEASLQDLNNRLDDPIEMRRFRPNIVVRGCDPFEEDLWQEIKIGEISYRVVKPCSRCGIPNINPQTAERGQEPSRALIRYRRRDGKILFGQNLIPNNVGNIKVGMPLEILKTL